VLFPPFLTSVGALIYTLVQLLDGLDGLDGLIPKDISLDDAIFSLYE